MPPSIDHLLIHRAEIRRLVPTDQGHGRWEDVPTTIATGVLFRLSLGTHREETEGKQWITRTGPVGYCRPEVDIARNDMVTNIVKEDGSVDTRLYRVTGVDRPSMVQHIRIGLEETQKQSAS